MPSRDVRMRGFARRSTVADTLVWLDGRIGPLESEQVDLAAAGGRILASDIASRLDVPGFDRAMMDGFAVRATDTLGASTYNPLSLSILDEVLPGTAYQGQVIAGQAVRIMTGAAIPEGADAVIPFEKVEVDEGAQRLAILDEVSPSRHIGPRGEDVQVGMTVLRRGRCLRPQDLGLLSSIAVQKVPVIRRPTVRIAITGNELLPPGSVPTGSQIADANGPMLAALATRDGATVRNPGIVADRPERILAALREPSDVILVSGGSSVGRDDHAPMLLAEHGDLAVHGIAMRPSSPAGMGLLGDRLVFLLPGNPVSCLCAYDFFAGRAIRVLSGRSADWPYRHTVAPLRRKLVSEIGRVDYARVQLYEDGVEPLAISGASVLSSTTRADGFVIIPGDSEGYPAGTEVQVYHYD